MQRPNDVTAWNVIFDEQTAHRHAAVRGTRTHPSVQLLKHGRRCLVYSPQGAQMCVDTAVNRWAPLREQQPAVSAYTTEACDETLPAAEVEAEIGVSDPDMKAWNIKYENWDLVRLNSFHMLLKLSSSSGVCAQHTFP